MTMSDVMDPIIDLAAFQSMSYVDRIICAIGYNDGWASF